MKAKEYRRNRQRAGLCGLAALLLLSATVCHAGEREEREENERREHERDKPATGSQRPARVEMTPVTREVTGANTILRSDVKATLPARQVVNIDNPYGDVHARFGGFEHRLEAHLVLQEPDGAAHIELKPVSRDADKRFSLIARLPKGTALRDGQRLDLSVLVPEGHDLRVRTEHGLIDVHGLRGDLDAVTVDGPIDLRGIRGTISASTTTGMIEAALGKAPRGSTQRLVTTTGDIRVGVDDHLDAALEMTTSSQFATDYSLTITPRPGAEPNKQAQALIGENHAKVLLESMRGEIRLLRRARFTAAGGATAADSEQEEEMEDNDSD